MTNRDSDGKVPEELWNIRDILYKAVEMQMADDAEEARRLTKEAYQRLSTFLDRTGSNLVAPRD